MRGVQLGIKWPRVVPIDIVFDQNVPIAGDLPGLLIQFHHGHRMTIGVLGAQPGQTMRKIADLVERIPGRELHGQLLLHIRDAHLHVEFMLFGVRERNGISNRRRRGPRANHSRECQENTGQTRPANHCPALLRMQTHEPLPFRRRCSSSFSHKPSKLPLDITRITSPRRTSLATYSAMASADGKALASRPRARNTSATATAHKRPPASEFRTLCRPGAASCTRATSSPWCAIRECVEPSTDSMSPAIQSFAAPKPYVSTGQKARSVARRIAAPDSSASPQNTMRPRRGTRFTSRLNCNSMAARSA